MAVELRRAFAGQLRVVPVFDAIELAVERGVEAPARLFAQVASNVVLALIGDLPKTKQFSTHRS